MNELCQYASLSERARFSMHHYTVQCSTERIRTKTFDWLSVFFTSFARAEIDGEIHNPGCVLTLFLEKKSQINKIFLQWNKNLLFDGFTYNTRGHFAHCSYFSSPLQRSEKYYATRKISARIICKTIE